MSGFNSLKGVQVGDILWHLKFGEMRVTKINSSTLYSISVEGVNTPYNTQCTIFGCDILTDVTPMVYWNKPEIIAPPPPKRLPKLEVDAKVIVSNSTGSYPRHFSHFDSDGKMWIFSNGMTSHTAGEYDIMAVCNYEVVEDGK